MRSPNLSRLKGIAFSTVLFCKGYYTIAWANRAHVPSSPGWEKLTKVWILPDSIAQIDLEVAKRLLELAELAMIREIGPKP